MLGVGRRVGGDLRLHERQGIFAAEEFEGRVIHRQDAIDLGAARHEEDCCDAEPLDQQQERQGQQLLTSFRE